MTLGTITSLLHALPSPASRRPPIATSLVLCLGPLEPFRPSDLLYSTFGEQLNTWQKASKIEYAARKEFRRIAALYEQEAR